MNRAYPPRTREMTLYLLRMAALLTDLWLRNQLAAYNRSCVDRFGFLIGQLDGRSWSPCWSELHVGHGLT